MIQGSEEWHAVRCGRITGSKIKGVVAGNSTTTHKNLIADLVCERMSGKHIGGYSNHYMDRGNELEPQAREAYEREYLVEVDQVAFVIHPHLDYAGCSPDGLVGEDGMIQIKCPKPHIHLNYIINGTVPKEYVRQVQWEMRCTKRKWSDFVSYCPQFPEPHNIWVKRIKRDNKLIAEIEAEVIEADREVETIIQKLRQ